MLIEKIVSNGHELLIPVGIASFVSADQKESSPSWIEREQDPEMSLIHLAPQLFHISMARAGDYIGMGP